MMSKLARMIAPSLIILTLLISLQGAGNPGEIAARVAGELFTEGQATPTYTPVWYEKTEKMHTTQFGYVRRLPIQSSPLVRTEPPQKTLTIYGKALGEKLWGDNAIWYLISESGKPLEYVYSGVFAEGEYVPSTKTNAQGKEIIVWLSKQEVEVMEHGLTLKKFAVVTGKRETPTPTGQYKILYRASPTTFYSAWPPGDPNYYPPTHINYALAFNGNNKNNNLFFYDCPWLTTFGPEADYQNKGSHGGICMQLADAAWLFSWTPDETLVKIQS